MKQRYLVVAIGLPLMLLVLLVCPAWATMLLVCGIAGVAAYELLRVAGKSVPKCVMIATVVLAVLEEAGIYFEHTSAGAAGNPSGGFPAFLVLPWLLVMYLFFIAVTRFGKKNAMPFSDVAVAAVGGIVFPLLYSCIFLMRMESDFGKLFVLAPFCIAFVGDSFSMYGGMLFGKYTGKLAPEVSPNKTWAGAVAGPVGSALALVLWGLIGSAIMDYVPNYGALIALGVVGNIFGQLGDLSMSLIKREAGIKDYSHLFLTHGGMLDRFDSSMFIAPVVWMFICAGMI